MSREISGLDVNTLATQKKLLSGKHYSYPFSFHDGGSNYILPEAASHSSPVILKEITKGASTSLKAQSLRGLENERLADATLFKKDGTYYLFCGYTGQAANALELFISDNLTGPYTKHPNSPIVIDPKRARMAGRIIEKEDKLYRLGQDNSRGYGNGITVAEITTLSKSQYQEVPVGEIHCTHALGPHTLNMHGKQLVFDYYQEKFSPLSGYRRVIAKLKSRK